MDSGQEGIGNSYKVLVNSPWDDQGPSKSKSIRDTVSFLP
jgi:hypothetical protein